MRASPIRGIREHSRAKAPAKLNLRLKVTGRRPDGYHELVSIMVQVDLFDHLELKDREAGRIELSCRGGEIPANSDNLAYKAAQAFFARTGIPGGISIELTKNIPVAAGLGGGSSDAAATLLALNEMWANPLGASELYDLALGLGADVPFFLQGRPALATGIGEILKPLKTWPKLWYVIVSPPLKVSTSWVYENLKLELTRGEYDYIVKSLGNEAFSVSELLENDLEKVTCARFPLIETIKRRLMDAGAEGALMTGSGPSVFGVFYSRDRAISARRFLISQDLGDVFIATNWERSRD